MKTREKWDGPTTEELEKRDFAKLPPGYSETPDRNICPFRKRVDWNSLPPITGQPYYVDGMECSHIDITPAIVLEKLSWQTIKIRRRKTNVTVTYEASTIWWKCIVNAIMGTLLLDRIIRYSSEYDELDKYRYFYRPIWVRVY